MSYTKQQVIDSELSALAVTRALLHQNWPDFEALMNSIDDPAAVIVSLAKINAQLFSALAMMLNEKPDVLLDRGVAYVVRKGARS